MVSEYADTVIRSLHKNNPKTNSNVQKLTIKALEVSYIRSSY